MLQLTFTEEEIKELDYQRYHHPHPRVQRKMEALLISYPCLRVVDLQQIQGESVRSLPPRCVIPLCMKTLNLEVESHFSSNGAAKGKSLTKFTPQLTIDAL
jgi:hypothetical protein